MTKKYKKLNDHNTNTTQTRKLSSLADFSVITNLYILLSLPYSFMSVAVRNSPTLTDIQSDQKVSVHLMITVQITPLSQHTSFLPHYLAQSDCLAANRQGQGDTRLTLMPSVIPNSNYVITVSD
jgi:hypothetical protein